MITNLLPNSFQTKVLMYEPFDVLDWTTFNQGTGSSEQITWQGQETAHVESETLDDNSSIGRIYDGVALDNFQGFKTQISEFRIWIDPGGTGWDSGNYIEYHTGMRDYNTDGAVSMWMLIGTSGIWMYDGGSFNHVAMVAIPTGSWTTFKCICDVTDRNTSTTTVYRDGALLVADADSSYTGANPGETKIGANGLIGVYVDWCQQKGVIVL